jgi:hypothetical protein
MGEDLEHRLEALGRRGHRALVAARGVDRLGFRLAEGQVASQPGDA